MKLISTLAGLLFLALACKPAEAHTISGRVSGSWQCVNAGSSRMPMMITLQPLDWTAPFSREEPQFTFSNVPPGNYTLEVICAAPGGNFPEMPMTISTADVEVEVVLPYPNLPKLAPAAMLTDHQGPLLGLAFSADGSTLVSAGENGTYSRWDVSSGQLLQTLFHGHTEITLPLTLSLDGSLLAFAESDGEIKVWDGQTGELRHTLSGLDGRPQGVAISPNRQLVAAWQEGENRQAAVWNSESGLLLYSFDMSPDQPLSPWVNSAMLFTPDGSNLISVVSQDREWRVEWRDSPSGALLTSKAPPVVEWVGLSTAHSAALSPDGQRFAFGTAGLENRGSLILWDPATNNVTTGRFALSIDRVAFSPDGAKVASTAYDNTVVFWDVATGAAKDVLVSDGRGIDAFAWSPDGALLAAADDQGQILLWQVP